jgi:hypothetical protein
MGPTRRDETRLTPCPCLLTSAPLIQRPARVAGWRAALDCQVPSALHGREFPESFPGAKAVLKVWSEFPHAFGSQTPGGFFFGALGSTLGKRALYWVHADPR